MNEAMNCPVCEEATPPTKTDAHQSSYNCPRCGQFALWGNLANAFPDGYLTPPRRAMMSHRLRRRMQQSNGKSFLVVENELTTFHLDDPLPTPAVQADSLILWLADHQPSPAQDKEISEAGVSAWIGTSITPNGQNDGLYWLQRQDPINALVKSTSSLPTRLQLTMKGW